jgi:hypothetical protein
MSEEKAGSEIGAYEVGFAKPPLSTQFRKGRSGNSNGRPKGAKSIASILAKMGRERVRITRNRRARMVSKLVAVFMQLINKATSGNLKATHELLAANRLFPESTGGIEFPTVPSERDAMVLQSILTRIRSTEAAVQPESNQQPQGKEDQ